MKLRNFIVPIQSLLMLMAASAFATAFPAPISWEEPTELISGRAERGPWQQNESRYDYVDDPSVAMDQEGTISTVWVDQSRKEVFYQRISPEGAKLGEPVNVSRTPDTFSWLPRVIVTSQKSEQVFILWQEIIFSGGSHGGEILFSRSENGGATFSEPINFSNSMGGDGKGRINQSIWHNGSLDLFMDKDGTLYAAWTEYDGPLWFSRSINSGETFSRPHMITGGANAKPARAPSITAGNDGAVFIAWSVGEDEAADIRLVHSTDKGVTFGEPSVLEQNKEYSDAPSLFMDDKGLVHLVYAESSGGPFGKYQIRYTRSLDQGRTFENSRQISNPMPNSMSSANFPAIECDANGNVYILWELFKDPRERSRALGMVVSIDGGRTFSTPSEVPSSNDPEGGFNGSLQGLLMDKLAVNKAGALAIVNSSFKEDQKSRVWLMRGNLTSETPKKKPASQPDASELRLIAPTVKGPGN